MRNLFFRNTDRFCTQWCCICLLKRSINVGLICLHKYLEMQAFPKIAPKSHLEWFINNLLWPNWNDVQLSEKQLSDKVRSLCLLATCFPIETFCRQHSSSFWMLILWWFHIIFGNWKGTHLNFKTIYISIFKSNWIRLRLIKSFTFFKPDWIKVSLHKPDPAWSSLVKLGQAWWIEPDRLSLMDQAQ